MSKFTEKYKQAETTAIKMEDVTFNIRLPTSANRKFERAVASSMAVRDPETGTFKVRDYEIADVFTAQHKAFLKSCVDSVDGLDFDPDEFYQSFPDAAEELYTKAMEMAQEEEDCAADEAGKSLPSSPGVSDGKEGLTSTIGLKKKAG